MNLTRFATVLMLTVAAQGRELETYPWDELAKSGRLSAGQVLRSENGPAELKIENTSDSPLQITILTIENPTITSSQYALRGEVRYEKVEKPGFLEMWNHFGEASAFFSRTLAEGGPMGQLLGTSSWREFILPFNATGAKEPLKKLVFNLQLPARGTVFLRKVTLVEIEGSAGVNGSSPGWWSNAASGWIESLLAAIIGSACWMLNRAASQNAQRQVVAPVCAWFIGFGAVLIVCGIVALFLGQPYAVWFPLVLIGAISTAIFAWRLRSYRRSLQEEELRRMSAIDAALP